VSAGAAGRTRTTTPGTGHVCQCTGSGKAANWRRKDTQHRPAVAVGLHKRVARGAGAECSPARAVREELITRNVARHVELPEWRRNTFRPWTAEEAKRFIAASKADPLHSAFVLLIVYGLRRGEVLGLRWDDIDFDAGTIHVRQQIQRSPRTSPRRKP
jgi:integrase